MGKVIQFVIFSLIALWLIGQGNKGAKTGIIDSAFGKYKQREDPTIFVLLVLGYYICGIGLFIGSFYYVFFHGD